MYPILKPGTVVKIKQLQKYKEPLTGCFITAEMAELSKSTAKITRVRVYDNNPLKMRYFIDLDNGAAVGLLTFLVYRY